jgi:hypothetical protein
VHALTSRSGKDMCAYIRANYSTANFSRFISMQGTANVKTLKPFLGSMIVIVSE